MYMAEFIKQMINEASEVSNELEITRPDMDRFAARSHQLAAKATDEGRMAEEIVGVTVKTRKAETEVEADEAIRPDSTVETLAKLPAIGIRGVSGYGARGNAEPAPGLRQVNTHVDIMAWRQGKRFIGEDEALRLAFKSLSTEEPLGWLTHHAVHDAGAWSFLERLFALRAPRWLSTAEVFSYTAPAHG